MTHQLHFWVYIRKKKMKMLIQKDIGPSMVRAALLKTAKTWKQPKCPSTDEWMDKEDVVDVQWNTLLFIC